MACSLARHAGGRVKLFAASSSFSQLPLRPAPTTRRCFQCSSGHGLLRPAATLPLNAAGVRHAAVSSTEQKRDFDLRHSVVNREQVEFFLDNGYLMVENFWNERELAAIRLDLEHLQTSGKLANVATTGDGETHTDVARNLQLCPLSPESSLFQSLPFSRKVSATLADLLLPQDRKDQSLLCYLSQVFWKPPNHGMGTSWHQDNEYFHVSDCQHCTAMWTAVHDATKDNGALRVIPGAWKSGQLKHVRDGFSDHHVTCREDVNEEEAVTLEVKAGGVVFFNFLTPHSTGANSTDKPRAGVAYHFLPATQYRPRQFPLPDGADWKTPAVWNHSGCSFGETEYGSGQDFDTEVVRTLRNSL